MIYVDWNIIYKYMYSIYETMCIKKSLYMLSSQYIPNRIQSLQVFVSDFVAST